MKSQRSKELAGFLRKLADWVEKHPEFLQEGREPRTPLFDPFDVLATQGADSLRKRLEALSRSDLKELIQQNRLDPSGLSNRWKDKRRMVELAYDRLLARQRHGDVFNEPSGLKS